MKRIVRVSKMKNLRTARGFAVPKNHNIEHYIADAFYRYMEGKFPK